MNEIELLTQRVEELGNAAGTWTNWSQFLTGVATAAALLYFVTSTIALKRASALSNAQVALADAKDKEFQLQLEARKQETLKLAAAAGPRMIEQQKTALVLRRLGPVNVIFESPRDFECEHLAEQIAWMVEQDAGWPVDKSLRDPRPHMLRGHGGSDVIVEGPAPHAMQLARQLSARNSILAISYEVDDLPPRTIRVCIFHKSGEYFIGQALKAGLPPEIRERLEEIERRSEKERAEYLALSPEEEPTQEELTSARMGGRGRLILWRAGSEGEKRYLETMERVRQRQANEAASNKADESQADEK